MKVHRPNISLDKKASSNQNEQKSLPRLSVGVTQAPDWTQFQPYKTEQLTVQALKENGREKAPRGVFQLEMSSFFLRRLLLSSIRVE